MRTLNTRMAIKLRTLAMAGPSPFHNAPTPSTAIVFRTQSAKPEYVPVGADWILDLMTCAKGMESQYGCSRSPGRVYTYVRWDGDRPHCDTGHASSEDHRAEVEVGRAGGSEHALRDLVRREVRRTSRAVS